MKEIIDWFNNYFYNCYYVKHDEFPESIFMFYDINYVRKLKLAKLEGKNYVEKTDITGVCLFQQDWKYKHFYCNYTLIWAYLRDNYSTNYDDFKSFITDRLEEYEINILTPDWVDDSVDVKLKEHSKMNILISSANGVLESIPMKEHSKMSILTQPYRLKINNVR